MLSLIKNLWNFFDGEKQKREMQKMYEQEQLRLEALLKEDDILQSIGSADVATNRTLFENKFCTDGVVEETDCFKRTGIITTLKSNHGTIDHSIFFNINTALAVFNELKVGCRVEYLAFHNVENDHVKVVKIEQVIDMFWDEEISAEEKIKEQIAELKNEKPTFFNIHQRNILGLITERKGQSLTIDTDYKPLDINLDEVSIDFIPKAGDRVYACCSVQSDENFVDKHGEVLQVTSIHPARLLKQEKCTVRKIYSDWGILNDDIYYTSDVVSSICKPNEGDTVHADLIECEVGNGKYIWRCIRLALIDRCLSASNVSPPVPSTKSSPHAINGNRAVHGNHAVTITDNLQCIFSGTFEKQDINATITNNSERIITVKSIELRRRRRDSLLRVNESRAKTNFPFVLLIGESKDVCFEVESRSYGETREEFIIHFDTFRVRRSINVIVCDGEKAAAEARSETNKENVIAEMRTNFNARNSIKRSRHYANEIWSRKNEVVPGVGLLTKRRFISQKIGLYEVPERLRKIYLTSESRIEMEEHIEEMFAHLKEDVNIGNYTRRFQTLLHLEEIEYFVNFRNYDRERAHFTRDGEFLSLVIENLAERRPSLVIGDIVRAINPWKDNDNDCDTRSFDGVIHKVLFNRILLKFNSGFQSKYNGEDYRLEFYFSRYGFRKQHFASNRIVKHLGDHFLFPSRIYLRDEPQLNVDLDDSWQLRQENNKHIWHNKSLNPIQKRAICNILRGEAKDMAYVIFGPPGTGKTMTLVETILQLVTLIPSARLLVGTPSNSSADLITTRLIDSGVLQPGDFVRLVSQNLVEKELIPDHLMTYCATVDIGTEGTCQDAMIVTESGLKLKCQMKHLGRHRVTISTCSTLGNFLQMGFPPEHFTHVLIDESGQCTEPEVMVAITQVAKSRGQVILAGDPNQLCAVVTNRYAGERGLSLSFLERILRRTPYSKDIIRFPDTHGYDPRLVTKLVYNYRSLPSILNVYSNLFYDSELIAKVAEHDSREADMLEKLNVLLPKSAIRRKNHGTFFYGVRSENKQEKDSPSWYNPIEAKNVFLMTIQLYRQHIQPESIGIITPYTKQVKHLRNLFTTADIAMPKIGSVEEFQGQERDVILISTVRSTKQFVSNDLRHSLGFVQCPKRMNVAISRARYLMFVFGNPHLLSLDSCWRSYIKYCVENDAYLGCDLPENMENIDPIVLDSQIR